MSALARQLWWQFILLQKNSIISISLVVTFVYGLILYFLKDTGNLNEVLVALVLNDPSVIGYFFMALAVYTERNHQILSAIFVSPLNLHQYILSKVISLSLVGMVCAIGLAVSVKGLSFQLLPYTTGALVICILTALLGLIMLTFSDEFLNFTMLSIPVFLLFVNLPLMHYLQVVDMGLMVRIFPIQGGLELISDSLTGRNNVNWFSYVSMLVWVPLFYVLAFRSFRNKIIHR